MNKQEYANAHRCWS